MKITVFLPGRMEETFERDIPVEPEYDVLREICDRAFDGFIEHVTVWYKNNYTDMFVDEEGRIKGLPRNEKATVIYHENVKVHCGVTDTSGMDYIAGGAVLFHEPITERLASIFRKHED